MKTIFRSTDRFLEDVRRDLDLDRLGSAAPKLSERLVHDDGHLVRGHRPGVPLGDVAQHLELAVDLVERSTPDADQVGLDLARDAEDRRAGGVGGGEGGGAAVIGIGVNCQTHPATAPSTSRPTQPR